jgi:hypothetical protein
LFVYYRKAYERVLNDMEPAGGWASEETGRERLARLPDTFDGRRPETIDDVVECVAREVADTRWQARLWTASVRFRAALVGVDLRVVRGDDQLLGSIVPEVRRALLNSSESARLTAGLPGRN